MLMYRTYLFLLLVITVTLTSCSTYNSTQAKYADIKSPGVFHIPVVADLDVKNEQIRGESNSIIAGTTSEIQLRESALANALERAKADVLIEPVYTKTTHNNKITTIVFVSPARFGTSNHINICTCSIICEIH